MWSRAQNTRAAGRLDCFVVSLLSMTKRGNVIAADFRTGETRGAKLEASTGEAKRAAELSDKEIQDSPKIEGTAIQKTNIGHTRPTETNRPQGV